jgi:hypothetical protein
MLTHPAVITTEHERDPAAVVAADALQLATDAVQKRRQV